MESATQKAFLFQSVTSRFPFQPFVAVFTDIHNRQHEQTVVQTLPAAELAAFIQN